MDKEKQAVEKKAAEDAAAAEAVKAKEAADAAAAAENAPVDLLPELEAALATINKLEAERNNYRRVAIAKKRGETTEDAVPPEEVEKIAQERADEIVRDRETAAATEAARKALEAKIKAEKENRELRTALRNKSGVNNAPAAASAPDKGKDVPGTAFFNPEQLAALKLMEKQMPKGVVLDPKKIEELHRRRTGR